MERDHKTFALGTGDNADRKGPGSELPEQGFPSVDRLLAVRKLRSSSRMTAFLPPCSADGAALSAPDVAADGLFFSYLYPP